MPAEVDSGGVWPRIVVVTRPTPYEELVARHGSRAQARFFLSTRDQDLAEIERTHHAIHEGIAEVTGAIALQWRRARVAREDLDRFVFEPNDVVVAVGQDGLVANTAKYLVGQTVIGINPCPDRFDGVLARHAPSDAGRLMACAVAGEGDLERRPMVDATTSDGQRIRALNEVFIGHATHQSARYTLAFGGRRERQSSSGLIVATGTGSTGWARSIRRRRTTDVTLPGPTDASLAFFVREAFPSVSTGTELVEGLIAGEGVLRVRSEMNTGGVVFGDGIEADRIDFHWGLEVEVRLAPCELRLLVE